MPPPGGGTVVVEVCASRDCRSIEGSQTVTAGNEIRWSTALSPGPHWWRVRHSSGGRVATPVWEVFIPEMDSPVPLVGDAQPDYNSDGVLDSSDLPHRLWCSREAGRCSVGANTDVNGDGFVDAYIVYTNEPPTGGGAFASSGQYQLGSPRGLTESRFSAGGYLFVSSASPAGDIDGDGCGELVIRVGGYPFRDVLTQYRLIRGGRDSGSDTLLYASLAEPDIAVADFNGDGFNELYMVSYSLSYYDVLLLRDPLILRRRFRGIRRVG